MAHDLQLAALHVTEVIEEDDPGVSDRVVVPAVHWPRSSVDAQIDLPMTILIHSFRRIFVISVPEASCKMRDEE